jgi:hypothetical protein
VGSTAGARVPSSAPTDHSSPGSTRPGGPTIERSADVAEHARCDGLGLGRLPAHTQGRPRCATCAVRRRTRPAPGRRGPGRPADFLDRGQLAGAQRPRSRRNYSGMSPITSSIWHQTSRAHPPPPLVELNVLGDVEPATTPRSRVVRRFRTTARRRLGRVPFGTCGILIIDPMERDRYLHQLCIEGLTVSDRPA